MAILANMYKISKVSRKLSGDGRQGWLYNMKELHTADPPPGHGKMAAIVHFIVGIFYPSRTVSTEPFVSGTQYQTLTSGKLSVCSVVRLEWC